jgi:hypothetical protein
MTTTIAKGDTIRIIPDAGTERVMVVSHVEHYVITLSDPEPPSLAAIHNGQHIDARRNQR